MTYVHVEQVEDMIRSWQAECGDFPAIYNQGNVLRDRLAKLTADIETPIDEITVSGWGVWAGQAIHPRVCRYIAGKINTLLRASQSGVVSGASPAVRSSEASERTTP